MFSYPIRVFSEDVLTTDFPLNMKKTGFNSYITLEVILFALLTHFEVYYLHYTLCDDNFSIPMLQTCAGR